MNTKIKTYAAKGLLEWQLALTAGEAVVRLHFKGGSMTSGNFIPAKFSTDNPAIQHLIENSAYFKKGRIFLHSAREKVSDKKETVNESKSSEIQKNGTPSNKPHLNDKESHRNNVRPLPADRRDQSLYL